MLKHNWRDNLLVLDGDLIAFRAVSVSLRQQVWPSTTDDPDDERVTMELDVPSAKNYFECAVNRVHRVGERVVVALSDGMNFRKQQFTEYKANRAGKAPPLGLSWFRQWIKKHLQWEQLPGIEADDLLGIYATAPGSNVVICSDDKDIRSIPSVFRRLSDEDGLSLARPEDEIISPAVADWRHMYQTLIGDAADGYPGCPKVGPVSAEKLLGNPGEMPLEELWVRVVKAFQKAGLDRDDALRQARMARILRWGDYTRTGDRPADFSVRLWEPPA